MKKYPWQTCPNKPTTPTVTTSPEQTDLYIPTKGELVQEFRPVEGGWSTSYVAAYDPGQYRKWQSEGFRYRKAIADPVPWKLSDPPTGKWHRPDWTAEMLPTGYRPLLDGEKREIGDEYFDTSEVKWVNYNAQRNLDAAADFGSMATRTNRPLPTPEKSLPEIPHGWRLVREDEKTAENAKVAKFSSVNMQGWSYNANGNGVCPMQWMDSHSYIIPIPDGEWIEWKGGERPVPLGSNIEARRRSGSVQEISRLTEGYDLCWRNDNDHRDFVAYRVIPQEKPAAPVVSTSEPEPKDPLAEVKKAFADGREIEYKSSPSAEWRPCLFPAWIRTCEYRIAPNQDSPKPEKETQPTNTMAAYTTYATTSTPTPINASSGASAEYSEPWSLPEVGSKWALQGSADPYIVKAASPSGIVCNVDGELKHHTPAQWGYLKPVQILSRRELKARAKNIRCLEAMILSPSNYASQSQPRKSMFRVILRPIWFRAKYVALGMGIGTVAGKAVVTKVVTAAPAVLNWLTEILS